MADKEVKFNTQHVGLLGWLFLIMFVLKLNPGGHLDSDVENWSWWWVTAPLWGSVLIVALVFATIGVTMLVLNFLDKRAATRRRNEAWKRLHGDAPNPNQPEGVLASLKRRLQRK